jgi:hypothetical protein
VSGRPAGCRTVVVPHADARVATTSGWRTPAGGIWRAALGLVVGAAVFTVLSSWLDRRAQRGREQSHGSEKLDVDAAAEEKRPSSASTSGAAGIALLAAVTLMPEAYDKGGPLVALSTTAGFVLSFVLATL